ncbi:hypothetical protein rpr22_0634 [Rickettsia prowazekii str. Rp22]|uniref:Uncharacterized protein n=1 Tax=Rickettsia prowazekii (strain Rp22) TaxID=449216 RepID=D5AXK4_RICPP|nr:hypothetical protein rpr22_0634 [Rickettsia prowazekii str. Rp22]AGJ01739.1 Peptidyl-tRNA hydrolase [Rickettsia prowazekii str. NMRC Madrid E]AGJ02235.1 hypothetical protein H375_90 [Rickettsia prowazekii str. Breinl]EOB09982.1 hypothetical protein H376_9270 [Rickettsia prowazekii str. GvF12]EOB10863.1 Peptidyl-tRNA hydrolase [Rickettsia prowazekii str. Cairo 3]
MICFTLLNDLLKKFSENNMSIFSYFHDIVCTLLTNAKR